MISFFVECRVYRKGYLRYRFGIPSEEVIRKGNYIRDDTDFILKDNFRQFRHQLSSISFYPKIVKNYRKLGKIFLGTKIRFAIKITINQLLYLFLL